MYKYLKHVLFRVDAETAHNLIINLLALAAVMPGIRHAVRGLYRSPDFPVELFGLKFKNPVGLAAGFDKDGIGWRGLALLGFGHIELGTVTPKPQPGNERPRIIRLQDEEGLMNWMGFPGRGADYLVDKLQEQDRGEVILGVNIGKNADTPLSSAGDDYQYLLHRFAPFSDYLAVNISSPNTFGLRSLQARQALDKLLSALAVSREEQENYLDRKVPLLVKISPDLSDNQLKDALDIIIHHGLDGVIATNTSIDRNLLKVNHSFRRGGISGKPIGTRSLDIVSKISNYSKGRLPIIGVGGISSVSEAREKLNSGAALIQVYTGLVYQGPGLVKKILQGLQS